MTIKEAQQLVDDWIQEYGVRYFNELTNKFKTWPIVKFVLIYISNLFQFHD